MPKPCPLGRHSGIALTVPLLARQMHLDSNTATCPTKKLEHIIYPRVDVENPEFSYEIDLQMVYFATSMLVYPEERGSS
jgi:hypothetical protein